MSMEQLLALANQTQEQKDAKRLREINALAEAGVATWDEIKEKTKIIRRQVIRDMK